MTPKEKFNQVIYWVLEEIRKEGLATPKGEDVCFEYQTSNDLIPTKDQERALRLLENEKAIRIVRLQYPKPFGFATGVEILGIKPIGCFLEILQPRFDEVYLIYSNSYSEKEKNIDNVKREQSLIKKTENVNNKPYTEVKSGKGYFKFYKEGERIIIGGKDTRHFRLLQCLCEPYFGVQKTVEAVFEAIRQPKDKNNSDLSDWTPQRKTKMLTLIEYSKKELQKNKKLQGKINYKFDNQKQNMWLELEE